MVETLRHVVLLRFKAGAGPFDVKRVERAFVSLKGQLPQVRGLEWGTNNSPEGLDQGFTHCFFLSFGSAADRDAYLVHPRHQEFVRLMEPLLEQAMVVDYWAQESAG